MPGGAPHYKKKEEYIYPLRGGLKPPLDQKVGRMPPFWGVRKWGGIPPVPHTPGSGAYWGVLGDIGVGHTWVLLGI